MPLDHYVTLGRSGLRVSPFALGAMTFGEDPGAAGCSVEESEKILAAYLDRGGNFIDTANFYTNGHSEKILGDFFKGRNNRDRVVLASKFFFNMHPGDPNGGGAGRKAVRDQLDETLRRMSTDCCTSFRPKQATSGSARWKSFATTVSTPAKCPGRAAPSHRSAEGPGTTRISGEAGYMTSTLGTKSASTPRSSASRRSRGRSRG